MAMMEINVVEMIIVDAEGLSNEEVEVFSYNRSNFDATLKSLGCITVSFVF